ncbi:Trk system potassium transporter TrkA [Faecalicatena contorta]|uniref:Trk system potassium transporter TrkA n=1 Tax=Lachnospiraceae TaxID=186803 RepID=UPI001F330200|nr:Trk system potassium transporter TrkA [Faecalicatena contorta]MCI6120479.1 Trk system potassium transporter TrkA [Lachnospiraceae bacterium]MCF2667262.1 Trk system potassium transporter TrkA [Faecalicatena contorta]MCI6533352.1 Trk system potassium transporter TrkA [Lachnospiraceae bacterium]MDY2613335.1 Trk system potassium transporter TrkA [Lachnospiraceae bacterium]MDY4206569.1 Trk system potassium transporter TrkA [Lachnospiraceae bacterium]
MKIVVIGDGKVGHKVAAQLSEEDYDIVLIDQNAGKLRESLNQMDVFCITGNGADVEIQKEADVPHADLVIACASTDEMNMLSCLLARRLGAKHTIARVRNPMYYRQIDILKEDLHLSMAVNPELAAANEISRVLLLPEACKVETFMKGRVELIEHVMREESLLAGLSLAEIYRKFQIKILVCAVKRGSEIYIPDGDFVLQQGDRLHIAAAHQDLKAFFKALGRRNAKIKKVLICGGGNVCFYLTRQLLQVGMQVKIVERNEKTCEYLCEALPGVTVIHGDAADHDLLLEEGIGNADAVVALTGMDEENIIMSLFAKTQGVSKIIAKVNEDSRAQMVEGLGIDSIISAKSAAADAIVGYVRARNNSYSSANVETIYRLLNGSLEAMEFIIKKESSLTNVPLKNLPTKPNNLIACIGRNRRIIIPNGEDHLEVGDSVIVITKDHIINDLKDILA